MIIVADISGATAVEVAASIAARIGYPPAEEFLTIALTKLCPDNVGNPGLGELAQELSTLSGAATVKFRKSEFYSQNTAKQPKPPEGTAPVASAGAVKPPLDPAESQISQLGYKLLKLIGVGGFGRVFLVENSAQKRFVVKQCGTSEEARAEHAVLSALNSKSIPKALRLHHAFIVMDFVVGRDMKGMVPTSVGLACQAGVAVARVLSYMHGAGYTHGDIKPANVMVDQRGDFILIDFGEAKQGATASRVEADIRMLGNLVRRCIMGNETSFDAPWPKRAAPRVSGLIDRARGETNQPSLTNLADNLALFTEEASTREGVLEELDSLYGSSDWLAERELDEKVARRLQRGPPPSYIA